MHGGHPFLRQGFGRQARTMKMVPAIRIRKPGSQEFKLTLTLYFLITMLAFSLFLKTPLLFYLLEYFVCLAKILSLLRFNADSRLNLRITSG